MSLTPQAQAQLAAVTIGGSGASSLSQAVREATIGFSVALSMTQTCELRLSFHDPQLDLVTSDLLKKRTPVTWQKHTFEVAVRAIEVIGGSPALTVTCRELGVQKMKRNKQVKTWRNLSWSSWVAVVAAEAGFTKTVIQPSATKTNITQKKEKDTPAESRWDVATRAAEELGYELFAAAGTLHFAQATYLASKLPVLGLKWHGSGATDTHAQLMQVPTVRDSDNDLEVGFSGTVALHRDLALEHMLPGVIQLAGVGPFSTKYLMSEMEIDVLNEDTVSVGVATPINATAAKVTT